jgi:glycogenin glucosyltransferase
MHAYITLLSTPDYLPGVACLAASLRRTGTTVPFVVALSADLPDATCVDAAACEGVSRVLPLPANPLLPQGWTQRSQHHQHWNHTFDKLRLFGLAGFDKLVYLDSDMLVLEALDDLFDAPHMAAVAAGQRLHPGWDRLNSGLMVIEPDAALPAQLAAMLERATDEMNAVGRAALGDQDLVNAFYADWPATGAHLDEGDNLIFEYLDAYVASGAYRLPQAAGDGRPVRVVHFTGRDKPWMWRGRLRLAWAAWRGRLGPAQREVLRSYLRLLGDVRRRPRDVALVSGPMRAG